MESMEIKLSRDTIGKIRQYRDMVGLDANQLEQLCSDAFVSGLDLITSADEKPVEQSTSSISGETITIPLSSNAIKKLNALRALNDGDVSAIDEAINGVIEKIATQEIHKHIGVQQITQQRYSSVDDQISSGMGDPDPVDEDEGEGIQRTEGGISEQDIDDDMNFGDHEMKAEPPEIDPTLPAEEAFSSIMDGKAKPVRLHKEHEFSTPKKKRLTESQMRKQRFNQKNLRAKVTSFNEGGSISDKF